MELTDYQKHLVVLINNETITDFYSFLKIELDKYGAIKHDKSLLSSPFVESNDTFYDVFVKEEYFFGLEDNSQVPILRNCVLEFITLINKLDRDKLIFTFNQVSTCYPAILFKQKNTPLYEFWSGTMNTLIFKYKDLLLFKMPDLQKLINDNYKTTFEVNTEEESKHRKKSLSYTRNLALASICISIILAIINLFMYNNQREVHITNKDTSKIMIVNQDTLLFKGINPEKLKDTSTVKTKVK